MSPKNKRKHESSSSSSSSESDEKSRKSHKSRMEEESHNKKSKLKTKFQFKSQSKKHKRSSSSSSTTSSSSTSSSSSSSSTDSSLEKLRNKKKHKIIIIKKGTKKIKTRNSEKDVTDIPLDLMSNSKKMAPMTKKEWEKKQNVVKKVYDESTGRHRLVKGDGEVIEEVVSKERHSAINKQATKGDGDYFQSKLSVYMKK